MFQHKKIRKSVSSFKGIRGWKRTDPSCELSSGAKRRQKCDVVDDQVDVRAVLDKDAVDRKSKRLGAAREETLVHPHQHTNAIGKFETKDL